MQLNIRGIQPHSGGALDFSFELDLSGVRIWGGQPFPHPVEVSGKVIERAGILTLRYTAVGDLCLPCSRCLADLSRPLIETFTHTVAESVENPDPGMDADEVIIAAGGMLDIATLVTEDVCLGLDPVTLCKPNCKGLCPKCGAELNTQDCKCN